MSPGTIVCFAATLRMALHSFVDGNESSWKSLKYMYCTTTTTTTTTITTSPQSNLRRARCKGSIDSDDSQVQDRPSTGKPSLRYLPSTRIPNYSASTALVCWRRCALRSRSIVIWRRSFSAALLPLRQESRVCLVLCFCTFILRQSQLRSWTWLCHKKANLTQNSTIYHAYGNTTNFSHTSQSSISTPFPRLKQ